MNHEQKAVAIFEDDQREIEKLQRFIPSEFKIIALSTIEACRKFINDEAYALELLCGAILVACIIDGRIAHRSEGVSDGQSLIAAMKQTSRFDSVMLLSNSGSGEIPGAHGHLVKVYDRQKCYLPKLEALVERWLQGNKALLRLDNFS